MYQTFPRTNKYRENLINDANYSQLHQPEILDITDHQSVKDMYKAKQSQLVALVASLPIIAGLVASIVLTLDSQELRRQANEVIELISEPMCIEGKVVIQVGIRSQTPLQKILITDRVTTLTSTITTVDSRVHYFTTIDTGVSQLPGGYIDIVGTDYQNKLLESAKEYKAVNCAY